MEESNVRLRKNIEYMQLQQSLIMMYLASGKQASLTP
jgi:hypothetical protein